MLQLKNLNDACYVDRTCCPKVMLRFKLFSNVGAISEKNGQLIKCVVYLKYALHIAVLVLTHLITLVVLIRNGMRQS